MKKIFAFVLLAASAWAQPVTPPTNTPLNVVRTSGAIVGPVSASTFAAANNLQATNANMSALGGLTSAADQLPYFTGPGTAAVTTLTSYSRTLLDDIDAATMRNTLGLVAIASSGSANDLSAGTVPLARVAGITTAQLSATAGILNAQLANSAITIGTTAIALGGTSTTLAGLTSVTSAGFTGDLTGNAATASVAPAGALSGTSLAANVVTSSLTGVGTIGTGVWQGTGITVLFGGTGRGTGATAYGLIAAGTTATGAQQTLPAGLTTEILVGGGASALPVWTTATGSGAPVRATSPVLVTPTLGAALATSINGNFFTTGSSTYTGTAGQTYTFPTTSATIARTDAANTFAGTQTFSNAISYGGVTLSAAVTGTGSMVLASSPALVTPSLGAATATSINGNFFTAGSSTYTGTGGQTYTFPTTSATVARTDAANTFAGAQTFSTSITDSGLTLGRVTYAGTAGILQDSANLTFDGTNLTAAGSVQSTTGAFVAAGSIVPIICYVKNLTIQAGAGAGTDIGTITIPAGITRWRGFGTNTGSSPVVTVLAETASGTLAAATFDVRTATGGGGSAVNVASLSGPSAAGVITGGATNNNILYSGVNTLTVRQTFNSANAGTISVYVTIYPLP